jgi:hypothetical protein
MDVLKERNKITEEILQGIFIQRSLFAMSKNVKQIQDKKMNSFHSDFWNKRIFITSGNSLILQHDKRERFLDMRTRIGKTGTKNPKKSQMVHNKIIWGQYGFLVKELAHGYTEAVRKDLLNI